MKTLTRLLATLVFGVGLVSSAQAATFTDCNATVTGYVTGAIDCQVSDIANDPNQDDVDGFFGFSDWQVILQGQDPANDLAGSYDFPGGPYDSMMLIFKDGAGTSLIGYLVSTDSGTWISPFRDPPFSLGTQIKEVSHISYYYRNCAPGDRGCEGEELPEPTTLALLGMGLAGIALVRRRRRH